MAALIATTMPAAQSAESLRVGRVSTNLRLGGNYLAVLRKNPRAARHVVLRSASSADASATATRSAVAIATSGFNEIESIRSLTSQAANSG